MAITVLKPNSWNNAVDAQDVVHHVFSYANSMNLCAARCGFEARWSHASGTWPLANVTWTKKDLTCMTCIVWEVRHAAD